MGLSRAGLEQRRSRTSAVSVSAQCPGFYFSVELLREDLAAGNKLR